MRNVSFRNQNWVFDENDRLMGLRTGGDFCTEHEMGMRRIKEAFIWTGSKHEGLKKFLIQQVPECLMYVETKDYEAIAFIPHASEKVVRDKIKYHTRMARGNDPVIAWDERTFLIAVPKTEEARKYREALNDLRQAFGDLDLCMGGPFSDRFFHGGGIGFFIVSAMPNDELEAADKRLREAAEKDRRIAKAVKKEGFEKVEKALQEAGHRWFCLRPHDIEEDGSVVYWLNPMDQQYNYFGGVSIQDLKDWVKGKGKIPGGGRAQRA